MASLYVFIKICFALTLFSDVYCEIPSYIKVCKRHDPNINDCILNSINQLREKLVKGIPEIEVPSIDPFALRNIELARGPDNAKLDINLTDVQVRGASKFIIKNFKADIDDVIQFTFKVILPLLNFDGKYQINAKLLMLELSETGDLHGNITQYESDIFLKANKVPRGDHFHLVFEKLKAKIRIGDSHIFLGNLFKGDSLLGQISNEIINTNNELFLQEIMPELENSLSLLFTDIANKVVESMTYEELFPEN